MLRIRQWWMVALGVLIVADVAVACAAAPGRALTVFTDLLLVALISTASVLMAGNAFGTHGRTRAFWTLLAAGCALWAINQILWARYEVFLNREVPDLFFGDVVLFVHVVPFIAAIALSPHRPREGKTFYLYSLNFLILMGWWMFLYAFVVFPDQYVSFNLDIYNHRYDELYLLENLVFLAVLTALAFQTHGAWRRIYRNLFIASAIYTAASLVANAAINRNLYHTGSLYDVPFLASMGWLIWVALLGWDLKPQDEVGSTPARAPAMLVSQLARFVLLTLPVMGYWAIFLGDAPLRMRMFRVAVVFGAIFVLGVCTFFRQYLLDQELVRLVEESQDRLEKMQRLQTQLVQKEKLASLGQLAAGVAHEINNPLAAILGYSEILASSGESASDHFTLANKIGQQARRTRDLVSGLLSFAQQSSAEKTLVDVGVLVRRAMQMNALKPEARNIRVQMNIAGDLPQVRGNSTQLFQGFVQIISNAIDAMDEKSGSLSITAAREGEEVVMEFADSGPGVNDPNRVFDPFYTTKQIGKGTGLGLSATYGMIQDHGGQIECHNRREGGAVFVLRLPVAVPAPQPAEAASAKA